MKNIKTCTRNTRNNSDEMHTDFLCILYYTTLALHVSGAICTHPQEHKLQSTAIGVRVIVMVCWKLGSPLQQVAAETPSHFPHILNVRVTSCRLP
jgi:hypothetical protein